MPPGYRLGALEMLCRYLQFPQRVPFVVEKMPWCPCPFVVKENRPVFCLLTWPSWATGLGKLLVYFLGCTEPVCWCKAASALAPLRSYDEVTMGGVQCTRLLSGQTQSAWILHSFWPWMKGQERKSEKLPFPYFKTTFFPLINFKVKEPLIFLLLL